MVCQQESKTNGRSSHACHGPASTDQVVLLSIEYRYILLTLFLPRDLQVWLKLVNINVYSNVNIIYYQSA